MDKKQIYNLSIINLLNKNNIQFEIKFYLIKITLYIGALNLSIDKYYFSNNYYVYYQNKFIKKLIFYD